MLFRSSVPEPKDGTESKSEYEDDDGSEKEITKEADSPEEEKESKSIPELEKKIASKGYCKERHRDQNHTVNSCHD